MGKVTCTNGTITGNVGSSGARSSVVQTSCPITGTITAPVSAQVVTDFNTAYAGYASIACGQTLSSTPGTMTLAPGVYCFNAAATMTNSTFTLNGPSSATWIFKVGTLGTGALTGTGFNVVMAGGGQPCNVNWWVAQAATMTDSNFVGTILAGAAITLTRGTFHGNALAKAGVTVTGTAVTGCAATKSHGEGDEDEDEVHCNQGVGNGPEGCDPGNSNHKHTSNDELGGTPGDPGRQGGNVKHHAKTESKRK
ncbi:MAG: hypothetical protein PVS3B2_08370 [Candidatus Dormibacteraceae bacterium]